MKLETMECAGSPAYGDCRSDKMSPGGVRVAYRYVGYRCTLCKRLLCEECSEDGTRCPWCEEVPA